MSKCQGIIGFIFGHKYVDIYDIDKRPVNAASYEKQIYALTNANNNLYYSYRNEASSLSTIPTESITKVYKHSICPRCGNTIESNQKFI